MTTYIASIETNRRGADADAVDTLHDALAAYHPSISMSPHGWTTITITVPAENLTQAAQTAAAVTEKAAGDLVSLTVMTEQERDQRIGFQTVPELVGVAEAATMLGVSPQRVRQMIDEGKLSAHRIGERGIALVRTEIKRKAAQ